MGSLFFSLWAERKTSLCHDPIIIEGGPMAERKTTTYSFSRRLGYTHYDVDVTCDPNAKATYEDRLLELIRSISSEDHHPSREICDDKQTA